MQFVRLASFFHVTGINCKAIDTVSLRSASILGRTTENIMVDDEYRKNHRNLTLSFAIDLFRSLGAKNKFVTFPCYPVFLDQKIEHSISLTIIFLLI